MKILLLEDDVALCDIVMEYLEDKGYQVDLAYDGEEALEKAYEEHYDLYVLDVNVPLIRGFDLLKILRENNDMTPAIFITSLNDIEDVSAGFESGADDYIKKPFDLAELLIRIKNIQKRTFTKVRSQTIAIGHNLYYDIDNELLVKDGENIVLPQKELKALKYFLKHANQLVSFDTLFRVMWDYDETPSPESLRAHIKNLRKSLGEDMIKNIRGSGYRFELKDV